MLFILKGGESWDGLGGDPYRADLLVDGGKIVQIAREINCEQAQQIDVEGCMILPGFIDSLNVYGCRGPGWGDNDLAEHTDPVQPELNVVYAFDQDAMNFQQLYRYGVTASGITPSVSNVLAGQAAVFYTYGRHPYQMLLKEGAAAIASVSEAPKKTYGSQNKQPMTAMGSFALLRQALQKARDYQPEKGYDAKCAALTAVLNGEQPLFVNCSTKGQMKNVLHLLKEFEQVKVVLTGAYGLDESFAEIADGRVSVVLGDLTDAFNRYSGQVDFVALKNLMEQGAQIACACCGDGFGSGKESLLWNGIQWYKHGIPQNQVLCSMTSVPAKLMGVQELTGSLEEGKNADLVVWTANPITTYRAAVKAVYVKGENLLEKERYASCW